MIPATCSQRGGTGGCGRWAEGMVTGRMEEGGGGGQGSNGRHKEKKD